MDNNKNIIQRNTLLKANRKMNIDKIVKFIFLALAVICASVSTGLIFLKKFFVEEKRSLTDTYNMTNIITLNVVVNTFCLLINTIPYFLFHYYYYRYLELAFDTKYIIWFTFVFLSCVIVISFLILNMLRNRKNRYISNPFDWVSIVLSFVFSIILVVGFDQLKVSLLTDEGLVTSSSTDQKFFFISGVLAIVFFVAYVIINKVSYYFIDRYIETVSNDESLEGEESGVTIKTLKEIQQENLLTTTEKILRSKVDSLNRLDALKEIVLKLQKFKEENLLSEEQYQKLVDKFIDQIR